MTRYISPKILSSKVTAGYYIIKPYKNASYNFKKSVDSKHIAAHSSTKKVAEDRFKADELKPSFWKKTTHFFKHVGVAIAFMIPIANSFILVHMVMRTKEKWVSPNSKEKTPLPSEPEVKPEPIKKAEIPVKKEDPKPIVKKPAQKAAYQPDVASPVKPTKVTDRINQINEKEKKKDAPLVLNGTGNTDIVKIKELNQQEILMAKSFFRIFPDRGSPDPDLMKLRKIHKEKDPEPSFADKQSLIPLILKAAGHTREEKLIPILDNLDALEKKIAQLDPMLKGEFFILEDYKKDIQKRLDELPYIMLINALFSLKQEAFQAKLNTFEFAKDRAFKGERTPIKISIKSS